MKKLIKVIATVLAIAVSPLILFVSTSNKLFILNQVDLGHNSGVMHQFLILSALMWAIGVLLYAFSKFRPVQYLLWCYLIAGPFFLVKTPIQAIDAVSFDTAAGLFLSFLIFMAVVIVFAKKVQFEQVVSLFSFFAVLLIGYESYVFIGGMEPQASEESNTSYVENSITGTLSQPNIYMMVLDEYQTDMFELTLNAKVKRGLGGFIYYPENTAVYGRTGMSLPSIFSGRPYDVTGSQRDYRAESFNSDRSILYWLKKAGYLEYAFVRDDIRANYDLSLFDVVKEHEDTKEFSVISTVVEDAAINAFRDLWIINNLPRPVSLGLLGSARLEALEAQNVLPQNANISSYYGFLEYLKVENSLPAKNRFTYIYLLLPHFPYIFDAGCSFSSDLVSTDPLEQSKCSTNLVLQFVERLKRFKRFRDSLVIVLADHGARFEVIDNRLESLEDKGYYSEEWSRARSRALLLVKPVGVDDRQVFRVSVFESALTDVAPTIAQAAKLELPFRFEGVSLVEPLPVNTGKTRSYYFFDKKGPNGWTDEMTRFTIRDGQVSQSETIKLEHNDMKPFSTYRRKSE